MVPLPLSYRERIARLSGVQAATPLNWFDGHYGSGDIALPAFACDPETLLKIFPQWRLTQEEQRGFIGEKVAFVAGRKLAARYGWKLGDHIHLHSPNYNVSLDLVLRGIYSAPGEDETMLAFHWEYLNDAMGQPNKPGAFWVLALTTDHAAGLMPRIDALFRNEAVETRTQTMQQFMLEFLAMLGNVKLILLSVCAAVVFAVLLIVVNSMGMSIRERTSELSVLRALGFGKWEVLRLLTSESLAITLAGALTGCLAAELLFVAIRGYRIGGMMPISVQADVFTLLLAVGVAVGIGLLSTLFPAYRACRVSIAQALRYVG